MKQLAEYTLEDGFSSYLKDPSLNKLLKELEKHQPRVVGLNFYRDFTSHSSVSELDHRLQQNDWLVTVCKLPEVDTQLQLTKPGIAPPAGVSPQRIGFADILTDDDGVVRRHLMVTEAFSGAKCVARQAFSLAVALRYLKIAIDLVSLSEERRLIL